MSEHECPTNQPDAAARADPAKPLNRPTLPLEQRRVQWTCGFLVLVATMAMLWSGRDLFWAASTKQEISRPEVLLQIDINTADAPEFAVLPAVGPILAARIVADREQHGPFATVQDLARVHGIGEKKIEQICVYCIVGGAPDALVALSSGPATPLAGKTQPAQRRDSAD